MFVVIVELSETFVCCTMTEAIFRMLHLDTEVSTRCDGAIRGNTLELLGVSGLADANPAPHQGNWA